MSVCVCLCVCSCVCACVCVSVCHLGEYRKQPTPGDRQQECHKEAKCKKTPRVEYRLWAMRMMQTRWTRTQAAQARQSSTQKLRIQREDV